jgi:ribosomal protein S18 acetylase RimI-like enzyme
MAAGEGDPSPRSSADAEWLALRRLGPEDDAARLSALMRAAFQAAYHQTTTAENLARFLDASYTPARQAAELADPGIITWVLTDLDDWVGYAQLRLAIARPDAVPAGAVELGRIYLLPEWQGSGAARHLLDAVEAEARTRGHDHLWLLVYPPAARAVRFYERQGFRIVGTAPFQYGAVTETDWVMLKSLLVDD